VDGRTADFDADGSGFFVGPTLFDHVSTEMSIYRDEIFGPVLSVLRVPSYEDAVALVNANQYGNGTAVFTNDGGAARRFENGSLLHPGQSRHQSLARSKSRRDKSWFSPQRLS
jgi:malonate-semialdehyde dehydrogenase (acetylating)/methylmalonate-semialdehyde dehydrogenase